MELQVAPSGKSLAVMDALVQRGVIDVDRSGSKPIVKWAGDQVDWAPRMRLGDLVPFLKVEVSGGDAATLSKVELVLALLQRGWQVADGAAEVQYKPGDSRVFPKEMVMRSALAFACLLKGEIFEKGAPHILLQQCDGYYKCLLKLADLSQFHLLEGFDRLTNRKFDRLSRGLPARASGPMGVGDPSLAIEDAAGDGEPIGDLMEAPAVLEASVAGGQQAAFVARPPPIRVRGQVVYYDGCTHTSRQQRMFISCQNRAHGRCQKYRFVRQHPSEHHVAAWLLAWQELSHTTDDRMAHYAMEPADDAIARWQALVV